METGIGDKIHLGKTVTPFDGIGQSKAIDSTASNFANANEKVQKIKRLINKDKCDEDVARYIPDTLKLMFQGMLENITAKEQTAQTCHTKTKNLEFQILFRQSHCKNLNSFHVCFLIKMKATNVNNGIGHDSITVNIFLAKEKY